MKRIYALFLMIFMLLSMTGCDNLKVETIEPTPMPPVETEISADEPAATECLYPEIVGPWELAMEKNEYAAILEYFGTSVRDSKPTMEIRSNGDFSYTLGVSGGAGTWSVAGDDIQAVYTTWNDGHEEEVHLTEIEEGGILYLHMQIGGIDVVWCQETEDTDIDAEALYQDILGTYRQALAERWDTVKCEENNLCFMLMYAVRDSVTDPLSEVGYYFEDINNDGYPELFIGFTDENQKDLFHIFTVDPDTMEKVEIAYGGERFYYHVSETDHGRILYHGSSSAFDSMDCVYALQGTTLVQQETLIYDSNADAQNPWSFNGEKISEDKAAEIMNGYGSEYAKLPLKPFTELK